MLTIEQIQHMLGDRVIAIVARETGIHPATIRAIRNGENTNPHLETVTKLSEYLERTTWPI